MKEMDGAQLSAWLECLSASEDLEHALGTEERSQLSVLLYLSASDGGAGLQTLEDSADEEFLRSFGGIAASLISLCRKMKQQAYIHKDRGTTGIAIRPGRGLRLPDPGGCEGSEQKNGGLAGDSLGGGDGGGHRPGQRDQDGGSPG